MTAITAGKSFKVDGKEVRFWDERCIKCKSENLKCMGTPCDEEGVPASYLYRCNDCGEEFEILRYFGPPIDC